MKNETLYTLILVSCLFIANHLTTAGETRIWTSADGSRTIKAEFVSAADGMVTLRNSSGKQNKYNLDKFSDEDRKWVEEQLKNAPPISVDSPVAVTSNNYTELVTGEWSRHQDHGLSFRLFARKALLTKPSPTKRGYPLVIYLHGKGGDVMTPDTPGLVGIFAKKNNYKERPCFLLVPQCPEGQFWTGKWSDSVVDIAKDMLRKLPVDKNRVYLTGYSMGGYGTFHLLGVEPKFFAAAVPVAGGGDPNSTRKYKKVPLWVFHGAKDDVVDVSQSQKMVEAIKKSRGDVEYTEFPDGTHGIGHQVYSDEKLHKWMFEQSRK